MKNIIKGWAIFLFFSLLHPANAAAFPCFITSIDSPPPAVEVIPPDDLRFLILQDSIELGDVDGENYGEFSPSIWENESVLRPIIEKNKEIQKKKIIGVILVKLLIDKYGKCETYSFIGSFVPELAEKVEEEIPNMQFLSAKSGGENIRSALTIRFDFRLPHKKWWEFWKVGTRIKPSAQEKK